MIKAGDRFRRLSLFLRGSRSRPGTWRSAVTSLL